VIPDSCVFCRYWSNHKLTEAVDMVPDPDCAEDGTDSDFAKVRQDSIVDAFLDIIGTEGKMRDFLNTIRKPNTAVGKCLTTTHGIPPMTLLCVRFGNYPQFQRFGATRNCRNRHKDFNKVHDFPKRLPMLLELDVSTTRQDIAELVPLWMIRKDGVCKIEFTMILRTRNQSSNIQEHHVISLEKLRENHHMNCACTVKFHTVKKKMADLKAKNMLTRERIHETKAVAKSGTRLLSNEEMMLKPMTQKQMSIEAEKAGKDAYDNFKSTIRLSRMIVVRNGTYCCICSRTYCCICSLDSLLV